MTRDDLFTLARGLGWTPGAKLTNVQRHALHLAIAGALTAPDLATARVHNADGSSSPMTSEQAADALLEEF